MHAARHRRSGSARGGACALVLAATLAAACADPAPRDPWPSGAVFAARGEAVAALLDQLQQLEGTPLARQARRLAAAVPDCAEVGGHAPAGDVRALAADLRCLDADDPLAALRDGMREGAPPDLLFALPVSPEWTDGRRLRGTLDLAPDGDALLEIVWPEARAEGALALLLPGAEPAGPAVLSPAGRALHVRVRPEDGLDVASLVPAGSQADRLFHLKSGLFASAVLDGTWEAAVYVPDRAGALPPAAVALGFRSRSAAVAAAERFLADLGTRWSVRPSTLRTPVGDGACLRALNVLPELAPCYVATDRALVVAWNPESLRTALAQPGASAGADGEARPGAGALDVDLSLVERTDALLARPLAPSERPPVADWPWRHLRARGERQGSDLRLRVALERAPS